ncbi:hypothetical protein OAA37_00555 [bacterium]|jgi:hypothetical protein|nr:hypothetical protein [bacterium]
MWQFFAMMALVLGGAAYGLWDQNLKLQKNIASQRVAIEQQEAAFKELQVQTKRQNEANTAMQSKNKKIELEMSRYLDIFARHNLTKLATAKPGLIEKRANNATKKVFESIENDSRDVDSLDDGVQLVPETNSTGAGDNNSNETGENRDSTAGVTEGN